jgi:hypothetical protein
LVEDGILVPLQEEAARSSRTAAVVKDWLGPCTQAVWKVIEQVREEQASIEQESAERESAFVATSSSEESRQIYMAFGILGGGSPGLTYMGWSEGASFLSLGILLLIWIGLSLVERSQRKRVLDTPSKAENGENVREKTSTDRFMVQQLWKMIDRASSLLFMLGIPICLSIVTRHKNFLDSSWLDILMVVVGVAVLIAIVFRHRLWRQTKEHHNAPPFSGKGSRNGPPETTQLMSVAIDSQKKVFSRERFAA